MANPIVVDFIVKGMPDVQRALRGVEAAAAAAERSAAAAARRGAQDRTKIADNEAKMKIAAMKKADAWQKQAQDKALRDVARLAKQRASTEEKELRQLVRAEERAQAERLRAAKAVDRELASMARKRSQDERNRARENNRIQAEVAREQARSDRKRDRESFIKSRDEMRNRRAFAEGIAGAAVSGVGSGMRRIGGKLQETAGLVGQLGGGFDLASSVQRNAKNAGATADLLNSAINPFSKVAENSKRRDRGEVEGVLDATTMQYGLTREKAIGGLQGFTGTTGDLSTGLKLLPKMAELSRATGTELDDMANAAGNVGLAFDDITDSGEKAEKIMKVLRTAAGMGKAGSVEISDMAVQMGKMVASSTKFSGDSVENINKMGMIAQMARGGGGAWNAASASTAVTAFVSTFGKGARLGEFKARNIKVFDDKNETQLRAPEEIIADAFDKTKGNTGEIASLFGSVFSMRAVNKFGDIYKKGYTGDDGKKYEGREAIIKSAHDMLSKTAMGEKDVTKASNARMGELDAQMAITQEQFDKAVRERIIPQLLKLVPVFEKLVPILVDLHAQALPAFVDLIKTIAEFADRNKELIRDIAAHPIGTIMAVEVTKSISGAMLGTVLKTLIQRAFGDAGMGVGGGGGAGGGGGLKNAGAAALVAVAATEGITMFNNNKEGTFKGEDGAHDLAAKVRAYMGGNRESGVSPEEAQKIVAQAQGRLQRDGGVLNQVGNILASPLDDQSAKNYQQYKSDQAMVDNKDLINALREAAVATRELAGKTGAAGTAGGPRTQNMTQRN